MTNSPSLTERQRDQVLERLSGYIDSEGILHLAAQSERSQLRNREKVVARFQALLQRALKRRKRRKPTQPTAASQERRLRKKKERSQIKKWRGDVHDYD